MIFVRIYGILLLETVVHECAHALAALILGVPVLSVAIGSGKWRLSLCKVKISPFPFSGYVEVPFDDLCARSIFQILLFFESGPCVQLIVSYALSRIFHNTLFSFALLWAFCTLIASNMPFISGTDLSTAIEVIRLKKSKTE